jgi:hypothetical protein
MKLCFSKLLCVVALAQMGWFCQSASAVLVNWDALIWASGSLSNSFDVDPGTPGNDVTVTVGGNTNTLTNDIATGGLTPQIDASLTGGLSPVQSSLDIAANLHTNSKIVLTIDFSAQYALGVRNVSFNIFDIDLGTNRDQIRNIYGIALDGSKVAATITNLGSAVTLTGTGLNQTLVGRVTSPDNSANGNATISFGSTPIIGLAFTFANNAGAPRYQQIALGDIYFEPIPEVNPALLAAVVCIAAVMLESRRRSHRSKR